MDRRQFLAASGFGLVSLAANKSFGFPVEKKKEKLPFIQEDWGQFPKEIGNARETLLNQVKCVLAANFEGDCPLDREQLGIALDLTLHAVEKLTPGPGPIAFYVFRTDQKPKEMPIDCGLIKSIYYRHFPGNTCTTCIVSYLVIENPFFKSPATMGPLGEDNPFLTNKTMGMLLTGTILYARLIAINMGAKLPYYGSVTSTNSDYYRIWVQKELAFWEECVKAKYGKAELKAPKAFIPNWV